MSVNLQRIHTQLAELNPKTKEIELQVRAEDLAGTRDHGGAHLFDAQGHKKDVPLKFEKVINNPFGPQDDLWRTKVQVPEGMNLATLRVTGFVDVDGKGRVWEGSVGHGVKAEPAKQDARTRIPTGEMDEEGQYNSHFSREHDLKSGKLSVKMYLSGDMVMSHQTQTYHSLKGLELQGNGYFGEAKTLQAVIIPRYIHKDRGGAGWQQTMHVEREMRDLAQKNTLTLTRGDDGTYRVAAPRGEAFAINKSTSAYSDMGDDYRFLGYEVALTNPATGKWDSKDGNNYFVPA